MSRLINLNNLVSNFFNLILPYISHSSTSTFFFYPSKVKEKIPSLVSSSFILYDVLKTWFTQSPRFFVFFSRHLYSIILSHLYIIRENRRREWKKDDERGQPLEAFSFFWTCYFTYIYNTESSPTSTRQDKRSFFLGWCIEAKGGLLVPLEENRYQKLCFFFSLSFQRLFFSFFLNGV